MLGSRAAFPGLAEFPASVTGHIRSLARGLPERLRPPVSDLAGRPGKGLRPMLLRACAGDGAHEDPARLIRLGAVVELLHLASLLHDDVIDRAATRRGAPAAHAILGPEVATLAGLACFALAGTEAADLGGGVDRLVSATVAGLSYGELLDVERAFDTALTLPDYLELVERKTADLFRLCCLLGATEARIGQEGIKAVAAFGRDFGVAFQVLDDCLDLDPGATGKPSGTDHMLGLFGAPTLCALRADTSGELEELLLRPDLTERDMPAVRQLVTALGGLATARRLARERYQHALAALDGLGGVSDAITGVATLAWRGRA